MICMASVESDAHECEIELVARFIVFHDQSDHKSAEVNDTEGLLEPQSMSARTAELLRPGSWSNRMRVQHPETG
jgi:hypothetical protein